MNQIEESLLWTLKKYSRQAEAVCALCRFLLMYHSTIWRSKNVQQNDRLAKQVIECFLQSHITALYIPTYCSCCPAMVCCHLQASLLSSVWLPKELLPDGHAAHEMVSLLISTQSCSWVTHGQYSPQIPPVQSRRRCWAPWWLTLYCFAPGLTVQL